MEPPTMADAPFQVPKRRCLQCNQSVTQAHPLGPGLPYHNDHAAHEEGSFGGTVPNSDAIGANPEYAQSFETLELGYHEANGGLFVYPKPRKGTRPPCSPPLSLPTGRPKPWTSSPKQIAIPGFSRLSDQLRSTLLDLILGRRFLKGSRIGDYEDLSLACRWLSVIQNRSCSDIYGDIGYAGVQVVVLVKMKLVRLSADFLSGSLEASYFRVFDKFVKKVIRNNPSCDTHRHVKLVDDTKFISAMGSSVVERIRVLKMDRCRGLERIDFRGLRRLRSLFIRSCLELKEVTGWEFLRELSWLEIDNCPSFRDCPDFQNLPSVKEFRYSSSYIVDSRPRSLLGISQCFRMRRLQIEGDYALDESGDLSSLKCLEVLSFYECRGLSTITGLSGLHSLTSLQLFCCKALSRPGSRLPDLSHMKQLVHIDVRGTPLEEIPGVEKLASLEILLCNGSMLKHLPDLHHLPALRKVWLGSTPLIKDDPSSFYFDKAEVLFNWEETRQVDVSDISDTEHNLTDSSEEDDESDEDNEDDD